MFEARESRLQCAKALHQCIRKMGTLRAFVGLDGFVDEIIYAVDKREDAHCFLRIPTLADFGKRIAEASGKSTNIELVTQRIKLGGNGPILANALAKFGVGVTYLGALGHPHLHNVFKPLAEKAEVFSIAEAAHTDALEFEDGKLMLGKMTPLIEITWENIHARMGREIFESRIASSHLVSFVNWTMLPSMSEIWESMLNESRLPDRHKGGIAFFDLCDPEKRKKGDIMKAMNLIGRFRNHFKVILGLNEKEAIALAKVYDVSVGEEGPKGRCALGKRLYERLEVDVLVVHPVRYALAITDEETIWVSGPFISKPVLSTGAGDHFNAGFCLGQMLGFSTRFSLHLGVTSSGHYVRSGQSPSLDDLEQLLINEA